jgi:hypothetical protein
MKTPRTSKGKLDIHAEMPRQLITENSPEELVATVADSSTLVMPRGKRKEDASKPLYLKRI